MTVASDRPALEIVRVFDAPPARVFSAWLDREEWQAWIGPEGVDDLTQQVRARGGVGGDELAERGEPLDLRLLGDEVLAVGVEHDRKLEVEDLGDRGASPGSPV